MTSIVGKFSVPATRDELEKKADTDHRHEITDVRLLDDTLNQVGEDIEQLESRNLVGHGFPEGKVTAPVGSVYTDRQATAGAVRWIKTSGTGNTGWQVEWGDTGARLYGHDRLASGELFLTRIGRVVHMEFRAAVFLNAPGQIAFPRLPIGFRGLSSSRFPLYVSAAGTSDVSVNLSSLGYMNVYSTSEGVAYSGETSYTTTNAWPSSLPGTPA